MLSGFAQVSVRTWLISETEAAVSGIRPRPLWVEVLTRTHPCSLRGQGIRPPARP